MWWLFVLLVTALVAFFVVKTMKATALKQQAQNRQLQQNALDDASAESQTLSSEGSQSTVDAMPAGVASGVGAKGDNTGSSGNLADSGSSGNSGSSNSAARVIQG